MSRAELTDGAVTEILRTRQSESTDMKPVLQVVFISPADETPNQIECYRISLCDGSDTLSGMLVPKLNHLVNSKKLQVFSIVRLTKFFSNHLGIFILGLDVLDKHGEVISQPEQINPAKAEMCEPDLSADNARSSPRSPNKSGAIYGSSQPTNQLASKFGNTSCKKEGPTTGANVEIETGGAHITISRPINSGNDNSSSHNVGGGIHITVQPPMSLASGGGCSTNTNPVPAPLPNGGIHIHVAGHQSMNNEQAAKSNNDPCEEMLIPALVVLATASVFFLLKCGK